MNTKGTPQLLSGIYGFVAGKVAGVARRRRARNKSEFQL
jgi:hypothetical protein